MRGAGAIQLSHCGYAPTVDETPKDLVREADRGASPRTPLIALTGVTVVVGIVVVVILAIALTLYFVV